MKMRQVPVAKFTFDESDGSLSFMRQSDGSDNVPISSNVDRSEILAEAQKYCKSTGIPSGIRLRIYDALLDEILVMDRVD